MNNGNNLLKYWPVILFCIAIIVGWTTFKITQANDSKRITDIEEKINGYTNNIKEMSPNLLLLNQGMIALMKAHKLDTTLLEASVKKLSQ